MLKGFGVLSTNLMRELSHPLSLPLMRGWDGVSLSWVFVSIIGLPSCLFFRVINDKAIIIAVANISSSIVVTTFKVTNVIIVILVSGIEIALNIS